MLFTPRGRTQTTSSRLNQRRKSEQIGTLLEGRREEFVIATKYTSGAQPNADRLVTGNSRRAMVASVEASLKRLKTDRIDIYWAHHPDGVMPAEEIVPGFEDLTRLALPIRLYTLVFRGTPLFVQLLIIYSSLASLSLIRESSSLWWFFRDGMHCVILALAMNTYAYTIEILAGVLRTTAHGEIEAALALGMTRSQLFIHVLIPSMLRRALPA